MARGELYKIWVIHKQSGLCLFEIDMNDVPGGEAFDANLLSGLLTSYFSFTKKALGEDIRFFETASFRFIFSIDDDFYIVLLGSTSVTKLVAEGILSIARKALKKNVSIDFADFDGDLTEFEELKKSLTEGLQLKGLDRIKHFRKVRKNQKFNDQISELEERIKQIQEQ